MSRSKKIFFLIAALFIMLLIYVSYDFSRRTTFPGSGKNGSSARHEADTIRKDSVASDTL